MAVAAPFKRILVPFDGNDASFIALDYGIALAKAGGTLTIMHVVDDRELVGDLAATEMGFDPTDSLADMERKGLALLDAGSRRARDAGIEPENELVHGGTVPSILAMQQRLGCDLVIAGTHGRSGAMRAIMGSTTEGVLRLSPVPVMTIRAAARRAKEGSLLERAVVAIDDSPPAEAALLLAATLSPSMGTHLSLCTAIDTHHLHDMAHQYGYDPTPFLQDLFTEARHDLQPLLARAGLRADDLVVLDGQAVDEILKFAEYRDADVIVIGSHGRRGLSRLILGSVAEGVVRRSLIPVLVVRPAVRSPAATFRVSSP
jgi:nucleotide-binding universal stress UspA family protein